MTTNGRPAPVTTNDGGDSKNRLNTQYKLPTIDVHCHVFGQSLLARAATIPPESEPGVVKFILAGGQSYTVRGDVQVWVQHRVHDPETKVSEVIEMLATVYQRGVVRLPSGTSWPLPDKADHPFLPLGAEVTFYGLGGHLAGFLPGVAGSFDKFAKYFAGDDGSNTDVAVNGVPNDGGGRAIVPLLLDLGYTPLDIQPYAASVAAASAVGLPPPRADADGFYGPEKHLYFDSAGFRYTVEMLAKVSADRPGTVWPLVPFDPRRPDGLDWVKRAINEMGYVGVKCYSRCGWSPDPARNSLMFGDKATALNKRLNEFYAFLVGKDVPILNHTSPTGFPPDGCLVLPAKYHTGSGFAPVCPPDGTELWDNSDPAKTNFKLWCRGWARLGIIDAANYCHYVQNTVSPYCWEPVLAQFGSLRLDLAHYGGELSVISHFYDLLRDDDAIAEKREALFNNPMVAPPKLFKDELFEKCCAQSAVRLTSRFLNEKLELGHVFTGRTRNPKYVRWLVESRPVFTYQSRDEIIAGLADAVRTEVRQPYVQQWLSEWTARYPLGWHAKIRELQKKHANCYADIAYLSGRSAEAFRKILKPIVNDAKNDATVRDKTMIGTDWFMTEMDGMSPDAFWQRVREVMPPHDPAYRPWATINALKWLNLAPRLGTMKSWYDKNAKSGKAELPAFWPGLKKFYEELAKK